MFQNLIIVREGSIGAAGDYCDSTTMKEDEEGCIGPERFDALLLQAATLLVQMHTGAVTATRLDEWLSASRCHGCAWHQVQRTWNFLDSGIIGSGDRS